MVNLCLALVIGLSLSCKRESRNQENEQEYISLNSVHDITRAAVEYADSILTTMTLEERIGQCLMPSINANTERVNLNKYKRYIRDFHIGGIVLLKGNVSAAKKLSEIGRDSEIPLFIAIDAEWGLGMRLEDAQVFPMNGKIRKGTEDISLYDYGQEIAKECRKIGINMVLGPVLDISSNKEGYIRNRSFGQDPKTVSEYGVAYAKGLESGGVMSVAKHFPGHGNVSTDTHKEAARLNKNITALDSTDLKPFKDYVNEGLNGVMAGHIQAPGLDPGGSVASVSMDILTSLLREEMGFKGLILTDAFNMGGAKGSTPTDALKAGADLVLCPDDVEKEYKEILKNVTSGKIALSIIDEHCRRILFTKYIFGIYN